MSGNDSETTGGAAGAAPSTAPPATAAAPTPPGLQPTQGENVSVPFGDTLEEKMETVVKMLDDMKKELNESKKANETLRKELEEVNEKEKEKIYKMSDGDSSSKSEDAGRPLKPIHHKNVDRPEKYGGDLDSWLKWSKSFKKFLKRQDGRWSSVLKLIEELRGRPVTADDEALWDTHLKENGAPDGILDDFKEQLSEYLETYTKGAAKTLVEACGDARALDAWRQLADNGHSLRQ